MLGSRLCFHDTYCGIDHNDNTCRFRVGVPVSHQSVSNRV